MAREASVFTRVDPQVKEQAEAVLSELGLSMSTAMNLYLKQIVIRRGIPFTVCLPEAKPIAYGSLTDEEFDSLMEESLKSYEAGKGMPLSSFEKKIREEIAGL